MTLLEVKHHLMRVKMATLSSLCALFHADPDTVRGMLSHWIRKGRVRQCTRKPACGSQCFKCPTATTEWYEWIELEMAAL